MTAAMFQAMRDALAEQKQNPLSIDDVAAMVAGQIGRSRVWNKKIRSAKRRNNIISFT